MTEQVVVAFEGEGSGRGELTWAQKGLWRAMQVTGSSLPLGGVSPVPPGSGVEEMARVLRFVHSRHPALRTRLSVPAVGMPRQELAAAGEAVLTVVDAGGRDPDEVAAEQQRGWEDKPFDHEGEWPVRMAVVCADGAPSRLVVVYCHLALDLQGLEALLADLATMDPATGRSAVPVLGIPPLRLAREQQQPPALRRNAASLQHWDATLRSIPARRFARSPGPADPARPRYREVGYRSVAALHAARLVAARTGLRTGPVLLAAAAVGLARVTGQDPSVLQVLVSNRFRPGLTRAVTPLTQSAPCVVEVGDAGFDEIAGRAERAIVVAGKNAYYDPRQLDEVGAHVDADRGEDVDVDCFYNDRRRAGHDDAGPPPDPAEVRAAMSRSGADGGRWLERFDHRLFVTVDNVVDAVHWTVCADTRHLSAADAAALPEQMEAAVVEAALRP